MTAHALSFPISSQLIRPDFQVMALARLPSNPILRARKRKARPLLRCGKVADAALWRS